jgi:RND superfamily putative drug exporter
VFTRLGNLAVRRRGAVLIATAALLVVSAVFGSGVIERLAGSGFDDPNSDSVAARAELDRIFDTGFADAAFLLTVTDSEPGTDAIDRDDVVDAGLAFTGEIAAMDGTDDVVSYWSARSPDSMRSVDGRRAILLLRFPGDANDPAREELSIRLTEDFAHTPRGPLTVEIGGRDPVFEQLGATAEDDLALAEAIAIPVTLLLLVLVFRSVVSALLPVLVGISAVVGSLLVLFVVTTFADVSIFAINLVTALGLGLAIDYSLLIVSRFREERAAGRDVDDAVRMTVRTAGRTVAFSGLTVAVSLAALLIFPLYFLRSFAYAGIGVIGFALLVSVVALPAALSLLGDRIELGSVGRRPKRRHAISSWRVMGARVVDKPWRYLILGVAALTLVAVPFLGVEWGESDHRALPSGDPVRRTTQLLTTEFASAEANAFPVVALGGIDPGDITNHAIALSLQPDVIRVDSATGSFVDGASTIPADDIADERFARPDATWFNVVPSVEPIGPEAEALVIATRTMDTPFDRVLVGGGTASLIDTKDAIFDRVPLAAGLIFGVTFVLLFLMFGSVLVPIKAILLNMVSLGATFGLMVLVFQEGNGAGLLGITPTGFTDISTPILIFAIAFGLSMDYEVFLLARIKEEYDLNGHNEDAIVNAIEKTGPIITAAAAVLTVTFLAFATSGLSFVKLFGVGLAVAVLIDAFIVRIAIVPALMAVAGRWNWWAPVPLRRLHDRWGIPESHTDVVIDLRAEAATGEPVVVVEQPQSDPFRNRSESSL